jgi:hypothetical protein
VCIHRQHHPIPNDVDPLYQQLMKDCWNFNPSKRPSMKKIASILRKQSHYTSLPTVEKEHNEVDLQVSSD